MHAALAAVDWHLVKTRIFNPDHAFAQALLRTVVIAVVAQFLGVLLGLVSALFQMSRVLALRVLANVYVLVVRGTPLIVQIFFMYYGANLLLGFNLFPRSIGPIEGVIVAGTVALAINEGAYMSEIIRAGIGAIDRGQMEAAKSVGMTYGLAMQRIILPQAAKVIVPPLGNEFNNMMKTTSLMQVISASELFYGFTQVNARLFKPFELFIA